MDISPAPIKQTQQEKELEQLIKAWTEINVHEGKKSGLSEKEIFKEILSNPLRQGLIRERVKMAQLKIEPMIMIIKKEN